jgi:hypothetical protein
MPYGTISGNNIFNRSGGAGVMPYGIAVNGTQTALALNGNGVDVTNIGIYYVGGSGYVLTEPYQYDVSSLASAKFPAGTFTGGVDILNAGAGMKVAEGSNARQGIATLVAGTVTVANTSAVSNSRIFLTIQTPGGTVGSVYVSAFSPGVSFTITSTSSLDTSIVAYEIFEPG